MHSKRALGAAAAFSGVLIVAGCSSGPGASAPSSASVPSSASAATDASTSTREIAVEITGGHTTEPEDNGRPVELIASVLGLDSSVFREAFSHVSPAPAGAEPDPAQVTLNKSALLASLAPYGVTNDELDRVSNYYRYNATAGESWPVTPASARAVVRDGVVVEVLIDDRGAGYTSAPDITIPGFPNTPLAVSLAFTRDTATNGHIESIRVAA